MTPAAPSTRPPAPVTHHHELAPSAELRHLGGPTRVGPRWPGLILVAVAVAVAWTLSAAAAELSPLVIAVVLGAALTNLGLIPDWSRPGLTFAAKSLLRIGIVLIGFRLAFGDVIALGAPGLGMVITVVVTTFFATQFLGRRLGCSKGLSMLVATGFAVCGASAIAAVEPFADADGEDIAFSIALVTLCGSLAIAVMSMLGPLLGLHGEAFGFWVGASVHDVAQVVATASTDGEQAVQAAMVVKLARIAMLAPLVAGISLAHRAGSGRRADTHGRRPPILPLFVVGFLAAAAVRSSGTIPTPWLGHIKLTEQLLLAAAMVGLGSGVQLRRLRRIGHRPLLLGLASWALIATIALVGTTIVR